MEDEVLTLIPKKKLKLLRLLFSRFVIMLLLMIVEVAVLVFVYHWFGAYFKLWTTIQTIFSAVMIVYLFNCQMEASAKLTWLYLIMLFPVPATFMLWFTRKELGHRIIRWKVEKLVEETKEFIPFDQEALTDEEVVKSGTDDLCRYLNRSGCFPLYRNSEVEYFSLGEYKYARLMEELKKAKHFIFLEYFIIDEGYMWGTIVKVLSDKAAEGVDVRVMYDGMCEATILPHDYPKRLQELGIKCKPFNPIKPFVSTQYNYRDHRKIAVIDGRVAFNGGVNFSDDYINRRKPFGHWKDVAVMVSGSAVQTFTLLFLQMWNIDEKEPDWEAAKISAPLTSSDGFVMPYGDIPLDNERVGEKVYMDILYRARDYVHIMTPYLILDDEVMTALVYAAQRGVDVKIILPGIPDKHLAYALAKTHYKTLVEAGVQIYEYTPGFVHAKMFVSDDEKAVVGSINLDYRSLYHHYECATYMYRCRCIGEMEQDYQKTLSQCSEVSLETIKKEKIIYKILGAVLKVVAPLM